MHKVSSYLSLQFSVALTGFVAVEIGVSLPLDHDQLLALAYTSSRYAHESFPEISLQPASRIHQPPRSRGTITDVFSCFPPPIYLPRQYPTISFAIGRINNVWSFVHALRSHHVFRWTPDSIRKRSLLLFSILFSSSPLLLGADLVCGDR